MNVSPLETSTCLKSVLGSSTDIEIMPFIDKLSHKIMENVHYLQTLGFNCSLKLKIENNLQYFNKKVNIWDY